MVIQLLFSIEKQTWSAMKVIELGLKCTGPGFCFFIYHWCRLTFYSLVISEFIEHTSPYQAQSLKIKLK